MGRSYSDGVEFEQAIEAVKSVAQILFQSDPTIQSVGVGRYGSRFGIRAVRGKSQPVLLGGVVAARRRPRVINGIPVHVTPVCSGKEVKLLLGVRSQQVGTPPRLGVVPERRTTSPLFCGAEIQNFDHDDRLGRLTTNDFSFGTLGCFVETRNRETALLSNNHVLAGSNQALAKDRITHAGSSTWGENSNWVANLARSVALIPTPLGAQLGSVIQNTVDAGYAVLQDRVVSDKGYHPERACPAPSYIVDTNRYKDKHVRVFKVGRTTGLRWGIVDAVGSHLQSVNYPGLGYCWFEDLIAVRSTDGQAFSQGGDSGALVVDEEGGAVGLVFANFGPYTYVCQLKPILEQLECSLLTRDGPVAPDDRPRTMSKPRSWSLAARGETP